MQYKILKDYSSVGDVVACGTLQVCIHITQAYMHTCHTLAHTITGKNLTSTLGGGDSFSVLELSTIVSA